MLLRFLRVHKMDAAAAEKQYRSVIQWRAEKHVDDYLLTFKEPEVCKRYAGNQTHGMDVDGHAVMVVRPGRM